MDIKSFLSVFFTIFLAEIADKTQLATIFFASDGKTSKLTVFLGSASALVLASAVAVFVGSALSHWINPKYLSWLAGMGLIIVGFWTLIKT